MKDINKLEEKIKLKISISKIDDELKINKRKNSLNRKMTAAACFCIVLMTGFSFAKDIEKYVKKVFSLSSDAIDSAIVEGYIQEVDDEYINSNNIEIKVENILVDNVSLMFSLLYKTEESNIEDIHINYFTIYTERGERVYQLDDTKDAYVGIAKSMEQGKIEKITQNEFKNTIKLGLWEERNEFNKLNIKIKNLNVKYSDGTIKSLDGDWDLNVDISDKFNNSNETEYIFDGENEHIKSGFATIYPTKMIVKLDLYEDYDISQIVDIALEDLSEYGMIFYLKNNEKIFRHTNIDYIGCDNQLIIIFENIGSYMELEDELELYLKTHGTSIVLKKIKR